MTQPLLAVNVNAPLFAEKMPAQLLADVLDFCYRSKRKKPATVDLLAAGDAEMTRLNRRHLGKNTTTDVLAFEDGEIEDGRVRLGDIAIGAEVALRESAARGIAFEHELSFYALHGLLHLLGMDDADDADRAKMHRAQAKALRDFGIDWKDECMEQAPEENE